METHTLIQRLLTYTRRHGLYASVRRGAVALRRAVLSNREVLFYVDLAQVHCPRCAGKQRGGMTVERKKIEGEIDRGDLEQIVNFWNPELCRRQMAERFRKGASLWVIKHDGRLAGYGWTLKGNTIEPHYFRLAQNDVHFFDFQVFPEYRGRGMNPILVTHILSEVAAECGGRAFIEAAEWNHAQLASLRKTSFNRLGRATKFTIFGRTIVCWDESERKACGQEIELKKVPIVTGTKGSKVPDLRL